MGQTLTQKIIARASGVDTVEAGDYVVVSPDYTVTAEMFWLRNLSHLEKIGVDRFIAPDKFVMVIDHTGPAAMSPPYYKTHESIREFAERTGFKNFYGVGRGGLRHSVMVEHGYARPGLLVISDERNIASIGAVGALNLAISWEVLTTMVVDRNWMQVPESALFEITGKFPYGCLVRDLVQAINKRVGPSTDLLQKSVEYAGDGLDELSMDDRQQLLATAYKAGADTAVMKPDARMLEYVDSRAEGRPYVVFEPDADADYPVRESFDLGDLTPSVTIPPHQHTVVPVNEVGTIKVDQATIGSCASNRLDDLRAAATILEGRRIDPHVVMYISPGSPEIYSAAGKEGLLEIFSNAGAAVLPPGCNTCWGYLGVLEPGQVSISTHQENYRGRNGSRDADIYLASPYTVAASAVLGRIADPRELLAAAPVA